MKKASRIISFVLGTVMAFSLTACDDFYVPSQAEKLIERLQTEIADIKAEIDADIANIETAYKAKDDELSVKIETNRQNLATLTQEYETTLESLQTADAQNSHAVETLKAEYLAKIAELATSEEFNALRSEYETTLSQLQSADKVNADKIDDLEKDYLESIKDLVSADQLSAIDSKYADEITALKNADALNSQAIDALSEEYKSAIEGILNSDDLNALRSEFNTALGALNAEDENIKASIKALDDKYLAELEKLADADDETLATLRSEFNTALGALNAEDENIKASIKALEDEYLAKLEEYAKSSELDSLRNEYETTLSQLQSADKVNADKIQQLKEDYLAGVEDLTKVEGLATDEELNALRADFEEAIANLQNPNTQAIDELRAEYISKLAQFASAEKLEELLEQYDTVYDALYANDQANAQAIEKLRTEYENAIKGLVSKAELAELDSEFASKYAELQTADNANAQAIERLRTEYENAIKGLVTTEQLNALDAEYEDELDELNKKSVSNANAIAQLEQDYQTAIEALAQATQDISGLRDDFTSAIIELEQAKEANAQAIAKLQQDYADALKDAVKQEDLDALETLINEYETEINKLKENGTLNAQAIAKLEKDYQTALDDIAKNSTELSELREKYLKDLAVLNEADNANEKAIETLNTQFGNSVRVIEAEIATMQAEINANKTELQGKIEALEEKHNTYESSVQSIIIAIQNLNAEQSERLDGVDGQINALIEQFNNKDSEHDGQIAEITRIQNQILDLLIIPEYTVTFNVNGGSAVASQTVEKGEKVVRPENPTKQGYTFDGWYADGEKWSFAGYSVTNNTTLEARWVANEYKVIFNRDGGSVVSDRVITYNEEFTLPQDPIKDGYAFGGWYYGETEVENNQAWDIHEEDLSIELKAKWNANVYAVSFNSNGGSTVDGKEMVYGETFTLPTAPTKTDCVFEGWYYGDTRILSYQIWTIHESDLAINLVAKWHVNWMTGKRFTETDNYIVENSISQVPLTLETEFKITKPELNSTQRYLLGNNGSGTNHTGKASTLFTLRINNNGCPLLYVFQSATNPRINYYVTFGKVQVADGKKNHLVITTDNVVTAENGITFYCYLNGVLKQTVKTDKTSDVSGVAHENQPIDLNRPVYNDLYIGGNLPKKDGTNTTEHFTGQLYSVSLYKDYRTAEEIKSDYEMGTNYADKDLMISYDLTSGKNSEGTFHDFSTYRNDARDNNKLWKWSTTPKYNPDDYSYSIMVVGDTQVVSQYNARDLALGKITEGNTYMDMIYDYIVDSIDDKNVKFVVGLGDVTQFNAKNEWEEAVRVTSKLNNKVPYSIVRGNHDLATGTWAGSSYLGNKTNKHEFEPYFIYDYWNGTSGTAAAENANINWNYCNTYYTQYFGNKYNSAYTSQFAYTYDGNPTNNVQFFTGNDQIEYMVVTLDYGPTDEMLAWASDIISRYPNHNVIIATHGYMMSEYDYANPDTYYGNRYINSGDSGLSATKGANGANANDGGEMWDELIKLHPNIKMVLCGHIETEIIEYRKDIGVNGNSVIQMLVDPQGIDAYNRQQPLYVQDSSDKANLLTGMVATYYFSEDGKTVDVEWYSPIQKAYYMEQGQFTFTTESVEYPRVVAKVKNGMGGSVTPESFEHNDSPVLITFKPDAGYGIKQVTRDGVNVTDQVNNNQLLVSDVNGYCEIEVEYYALKFFPINDVYSAIKSMNKSSKNSETIVTAYVKQKNVVSTQFNY